MSWIIQCDARARVWAAWASSWHAVEIESFDYIACGLVHSTGSHSPIRFRTVWPESPRTGSGREYGYPKVPEATGCPWNALLWSAVAIESTALREMSGIHGKRSSPVQNRIHYGWGVRRTKRAAYERRSLDHWTKRPNLTCSNCKPYRVISHRSHCRFKSFPVHALESILLQHYTVRCVQCIYTVYAFWLIGLLILHLVCCWTRA